jgi:hypothetical protein
MKYRQGDQLIRERDLAEGKTVWVILTIYGENSPRVNGPFELRRNNDDWGFEPDPGTDYQPSGEPLAPCAYDFSEGSIELWEVGP